MEQNEGFEKKPLSFGFSKRQETKQLGTSAVGEHKDEVDDSKDFVLSVEKNEVKSTKPIQKSKTKEYVIPLINKNRWRLNLSDGDGTSDTQENLDLIAAKEILQDSAKLNGDWEERGTVNNSSRAIPLLMQNKVPDGFETDDKLNVDIRPEEPKDADYDQIPIEQFGLALLKGMGWKEGKGIGKNAKMIAPIEAQLRPKGLGLGADKTNDQGKEKNSNTQKVVENEEKLELKCGAYCIILSGQNKDLYGMVEGIDEDNARAMIKLSVSGKVVNLMQTIIRLVSKKDFEKHSKYLNKLMVDKYKNEEAKKSSKKRENYEENGHGRDLDKNDVEYQDRSKGDKLSKDDRDFRKESKRRKRSKYSSDKDYNDEKQDRKHKHHKSHKKSKSTSSEFQRSHRYKDHHDSGSEDILSDIEIQRPWLQKDLRVRIVDKNLKGGRYYKEKVIVEDVISPGLCVCKTDDGKVIEHVSQSSMETVIPRTDNAVVLIVNGADQGQKGVIMKRDKDKCLALVQLLVDRDVVLRLQYDQICEYVGDVQYIE